MPDEMMAAVEVGTVRLAYGRAGAGPAVILIHAGIADRRMWDRQIGSFSKEFTTVRHDLRGFGESEMGEATFSHRRDLSALMDALGLDSAFLVACSMGGAVALETALEEPDRVNGLVLVGAGTPGVVPEGGYYEPPEWEEIAATLRRGELDRAADLEADMWVTGYGRPVSAVPAPIREQVRRMNRRAMSTEELRGELEQRPDPGVATRLDEVACPALVMVGDHDFPDIVWSAGYLSDRLAGAGAAVTIPNTAHLPNLEQPDRFNQEVLRFLNSAA